MGKYDKTQQDDSTAAVYTSPVAAPVADAAPADAPLTVAQLAEKHGHSSPAPIGEDTPFTPMHLLADALNGWTRHTAYKSEPVTLSDADYLAAIEAAKQGVAHEPANKRPLTTFTKEQAEAKMAADLAATIAARKLPKKNTQRVPQGHAQHLVMQKARSLAQSSGVKLKGGR